MKMENVTILNEGNPLPIEEANGYLFTVSPSTAKKGRAYYTDQPVKLTEYEKKMPGVVVGQNRGMLFSSSRAIAGDYVVPELADLNIIIVPEKSRKLYPQDDDENKIFWKGNGEHSVKDVVSDGTGVHYLCNSKGQMAFDLWFKLKDLGYGTKGMLMPGLATDIGKKVVDIWGVERKITLGNTILLNTSLVKGVVAYNSLEEFKAHGEEWGLTVMKKQWQSGDHKQEKKRIIGTQANATNLALTSDEVSEIIKPEAREIFGMKYPLISWMKMANINTSRGRAIAARPDLLYKDLIMEQLNNQATNRFYHLAQGKAKVKAEYLKMFPDRLAFSKVYVDGMDINEAAKECAASGIHGELRVNPAFAGIKRTDNNTVTYKEETHLDAKGRFIEVAMVRYPHGAPSETINVKLYLDSTVPEDVVVFPLPVANDDGTIPVRILYAFRLQGADFDGDAITAYKEKLWVEAQKRNAGKSYMIIPVNTEGTEKDKTLVKDDDDDTNDDRVKWTVFCQNKIASLSNQVGLIATSLKYFLSQKATSLRNGENVERDAKIIVDHACAMGDDIDEFKHGKANNDLVPFVISGEDKDEYLYGPYFNKYAMKYKSKDAFEKSLFMKNGSPKWAGDGVLDMYAVETEQLMAKAGLPIKSVVTKATDGTLRFHFAIKPATWNAKPVDLFKAEHGEGQKCVALPDALEKAYGIEAGTVFTSKSLFQMLYRDHAATCSSLMGGLTDEDDHDAYIKAISKIGERYALAKIAIVTWAKASKKAKDGTELNAEEAMKYFTTLMVQHNKNTRSIIEVLTKVGKYVREDGTEHEKTTFSALRTLNYFLDVCGDGLLLLKEEAPDFPKVSESILAAMKVATPDLEKAKENAKKELDAIDKIANTLSTKTTNEVVEDIEEMSSEQLAEILDDSFVLDDGEEHFDFMDN